MDPKVPGSIVREVKLGESRIPPDDPITPNVSELVLKLGPPYGL